MEKIWPNDVEAYHGLAAVDCFIGATKMSMTRGFEYGGRTCNRRSSGRGKK